MSSHRLIAFAEATGGVAKQNALVDELFLNYFCQEQYINDPGVLLAAATKVGLDPAAAERVINDKSEYKDDVLEQYDTYARGVRGVPHFYIGDHTISGAQPPHVFLDILTKAANDA
mmetsp:Transcript_2832/g.8902  ORF Transcript_2832/g.8902 Transcript_2832/m.8902 type:complete len:116 (-) Transcript_2832:255-602(-)